jgi:hypothetical protein
MININGYDIQFFLSSNISIKKIITELRLGWTSEWYGCLKWRGRLKVNMMMKIEFKKIIVANGLIQDIKGYHIQLCSLSNSPIDKSYDGCTIGRNLLVIKLLIERLRPTFYELD